jgi:hypothetical protein
MSKIYGIPTATPINPNKFTGGETEPLIVTYDDYYRASHTTKEIKEAVDKNRQVWLLEGNNIIPLARISEEWATFVNHSGNRTVTFYDIADGFVSIATANFPEDCASTQFVEAAVNGVLGEIDNRGYAAESWVEERIQNSMSTTKGVYELIETITIDEAIKTVDRTKDPNGTPYNFEAVTIEYANEAVEANSYIQATFTTTESKTVRAYIDGGLKTTTSRGYISAFPRYNKLLCEYTQPVKDSYGTPNSLRPSNNDAYFVNKAPIKRVTITGGTNIPTGSVIKIWGVRANA